jgi:hypothetical protein
MSDHDRLHELLEQTAPDRPELDPGSRAAAVARRGRAARHRDRGLVAVAVVVLAVGLPLALIDRHRAATPTPQVAVEVEPCPAAPVDTERLRPVTALVDVVAVRSCPIVGNDPDPLPTEPLIGADARAFAGDVAALPDYRMPSFCASAQLTMSPWALQVQTSSGQTLVVGTSLRDCSPVDSGEHEVGAAEVLAAFRGNLGRQDAGAASPALECPPGDQLGDGADTWNASFDPTAATAGIVCQQSFEEDRWSATVEGRLNTGQLAAVRNGLASPPRTHDGFGLDCGGVIRQQLVVLADADGDQAAWRSGCSDGPVLVSIRGEWDLGRPAQNALHDAIIDGGLSR